MPKFSIVIPVYSEIDADSTDLNGDQQHFRGKTVQRAIKSILMQQFPDWELILVDDGCVDWPIGYDVGLLTPEKPITPSIMEHYAAADPDRIKVVYIPNQNRAIARNKGMEAATGDWICWLDSDDEYSTHYLRELNQAIIDFPEYKIFNFGSIIHFPDHHTATRETFKPIIEGGGHEYFRSGHIGAGSFVFSRELWASDSKYRIPDEVNPYQFAATSKFDMRFSDSEPHIDDPVGAFSDGVYRHGLSLGNPWGDDFLQFFLLTRDNHSKPLDVLLYIQYPRAHEEVYRHFGEVYELTSEGVLQRV